MNSIAVVLVRLIGIGVLVTLLNACSSMRINDIAVTDQSFKVEEYFQGTSRAHGIVFDRSGAAIRYFTVDLIPPAFLNRTYRKLRSSVAFS